MSWLSVAILIAWIIVASRFVYMIGWDRGWNKGFDEAAATIEEAVASNTARAWEQRNLGKGKDV